MLGYLPELTAVGANFIRDMGDKGGFSRSSEPNV